jgi:Xaa-Pro dipeptidase
MLFERVDLEAVSAQLEAMGVDGWLLYDFHGLNPTAKRVIGYGGMATRRLFVWLPVRGAPVAIAHRIELQPFGEFPGEVRPYATWQELHRELGKLVEGKTVAMEISLADAVPYLDRVPFGVVDLLQRVVGATVVDSADLVTEFAAAWSKTELIDHIDASKILSRVANENLNFAVNQVGQITEFELQQKVITELEEAGLHLNDPPIVGFGPGSGSPHYEPSEDRPRVLEADQVVLLDLWAGKSLETVFADQTWMGFSGKNPPEKVIEVWELARGARDAVLDHIRDNYLSKPLTGKELDEISRGHIKDGGYGEFFTHRTGHSIDIDLHGSGPHLDSYETADERCLRPGVGFSVEPGIYMDGEFGVRTEVNVHLGADGPLVTPERLQSEIIVAE